MNTSAPNSSDTICALATGHGGAIGVIRLSGPDALTIADSIFTPAKEGKPLTCRRGFTIAYGTITGEGGEVVDDVLVSVFRSPHSYTGEDSVEIACHASLYILQTVLSLLIAAGCRMAEPGEYTRRAFLNGRMDLSQAEAVADLIASSSAAEHRLAINQMRGNFSRKLADLRSQLLHLTSLLELEIDFSDHEELEFADRSELIRIANEVEQTVTNLADSFRLGNAVKNGIPVAIIGQTNVGKSTLLNALVGEDKAIVSDIHGTTRDVIEDTVVVDGVTFRFIDTAGIRQTSDAIETMGIERSFHAIDSAQIVILMQDLTQEPEAFLAFIEQLQPHLKDKQVVIVQNKCDVGTRTNAEGVGEAKRSQCANTVGAHPCGRPLDDVRMKVARSALANSELSTFKTRANECSPSSLGDCRVQPSLSNFQLSTIISLSAKHGTNIDVLRKTLVDLASVPDMSSADVVVTNIRHYEALTHAREAIHRVKQGLAEDTPTDLISQDLRDCSYHLGSIIGEVSVEDVLENVFSHFCIGK